MSEKIPKPPKVRIEGTTMWSTIPWPPDGSPDAPVLITSNLDTFRPIATKRSIPFDPVAAEQRWTQKRPKHDVPGPSSSANPIIISSDEEGDDDSDGDLPSSRHTLHPTRQPLGPIRASNGAANRQDMSDLDSGTEPPSSSAANPLPYRSFNPVHSSGGPAFSQPTSSRRFHAEPWSPAMPSHFSSDAPNQPTPSKPPNRPAPTRPPNEPALSPEQLEVVELAAQGYNIFYTGSAGCGKSTVLHAIVRRLREMGLNVHVVAPTGIVALAIDGTTTWRYAGWSPHSLKKPLHVLQKAAREHRDQRVRDRLRNTDVLIIDEISMIENLFFQRLSDVLRYVKSFDDDYEDGPHSEETRANARPSDVDEPFGGVQVIVTGDFCQLPPVKPFVNCLCGKDFLRCKESGVYSCSSKKGKKACKYGTYVESDKWAFQSDAWRDCNFRHILLRTIYRQNDSRFVKILQSCRTGRPLSQEDIDLLMTDRPVPQDAVRLFPKRWEVAELNRKQFDRLTDASRPFPCLDYFRQAPTANEDEVEENKKRQLASDPGAPMQPPLCVLKDHRFDELAQLKTGMLVVLLSNIDLENRLCNGSQGVIEGFEPHDPSRLPKRRSNKEPTGTLVGEDAGFREAMINKFCDQARLYHEFKRAPPLGWPIVRFHNGNTRTIYPECQATDVGDESPYSTLCRTQLPLAPAWALSVHKSQGMTLERVVVNLQSAFEAGQVYVALSRAKSLEGLKIEGRIHDLQTGLRVNEEVQRFLEEYFAGQEDRPGQVGLGRSALRGGYY